MQKLIDYLATVTAEDNRWGLFINPDDLDDFKIGQLCLENGGLPKKYVFVDTLDKLSCKQQDLFEALRFYMILGKKGKKKPIYYKGKRVVVNGDVIVERWHRLDPEFRDFLEQEAQKIMQEWAWDDAWFKVNGIKDDLDLQKQKLTVN